MRSLIISDQIALEEGAEVQQMQIVSCQSAVPPLLVFVRLFAGVSPVV